MANRNDVLAYCNQVLQPQLFKDYCPNGLQVEGRSEIQKIISGVTASRALIEAAIAKGADTVLVHHGLFWRGHDGSVTGWLKQRLALLLAHDINLLAYHLPLDAHAQWGNNAQLGELMGWQVTNRFGDQALGMVGHPAQGEVNAQTLTQSLKDKLGTTPVAVVPNPARAIQNIAWCTGGAQSWLKARSPRVLMRSSRVKFPSHKRIWRKKQVWHFLRVGTTPPSATVHRHWRRMFAVVLVSRMSSLIYTTRLSA